MKLPEQKRPKQNWMVSAGTRPSACMRRTDLIPAVWLGTLSAAALSLLALVVGMFLIYNTISVSVVRRRPEIGVLRAIGAGRQAPGLEEAIGTKNSLFVTSEGVGIRQHVRYRRLPGEVRDHVPVGLDGCA